MLTAHTFYNQHFLVFFVNSTLELWDALFQNSAVLE
jgi:hypothetical protein